jgi:hypothetical protein
MQQDAQARNKQIHKQTVVIYIFFYSLVQLEFKPTIFNSFHMPGKGLNVLTLKV